MRRTGQLFAGIVLLAGCGGEQTLTETTAHSQSRAQALEASASAVNQDLATLRRVTAKFHRFEAARAPNGRPRSRRA
jgi:transposase-like protein